MEKKDKPNYAIIVSGLIGIITAFISQSGPIKEIICKIAHYWPL